MRLLMEVLGCSLETAKFPNRRSGQIEEVPFLQISGVDSDFPPHTPRRVAQSLLGRYRGKFFLGSFAERSSGRRQDQTLYFLSFTPPETLMDCIVFAVDRNYFHLFFLGKPHNQLTGHH